MLTINETSINIPGFSELKEFQERFNLFKPSSLTLAVECLKKMEQDLTESQINNIWFHYSIFFGELLFSINNISDIIDYSKVTDELRGKVLNLTISPTNSISTFL